MKVLLVEDEAQLAKIYTLIFESLGCICEVAHSADQALKLLGRNEYRFTFIDLMLPDIGGQELLQQMQTLENYEKTNVMVLTNMGSGFNAEELYELGAKEILLKINTGPDEIRNLLKKYT